MVLLNRNNWWLHRPWFLASIFLACIGFVVWLVEAVAIRAIPGGGSRSGLLFGVMAAGIILFECALWARKKLRTWRLFGRALTWMIAHIWLGLLAVPLAVMHSGLSFGGVLSSALMLVFLVVIASGLLGLLLQQILPSRILLEVPTETIYSQIPRIICFQRRDAAAIVEKAAGVTDLLAGDELCERFGIKGDIDFGDPLITNPVRSVGSLTGLVSQSLSLMQMGQLAEAMALVEFFEHHLKPFLYPGRVQSLPLADPLRARTLFRDLRRKVDVSLEDAVDALEEIVRQRRDLIKQARLHFWLHAWLLVHLPLSIALLLLLGMHAWVALKYW